MAESTRSEKIEIFGINVTRKNLYLAMLVLIVLFFLLDNFVDNTLMLAIPFLIVGGVLNYYAFWKGQF